MITQFLKRNSLLLAFFCFYLLVVAMVLIEIDKQYYQRDKRNYINTAFQEKVLRSSLEEGDPLEDAFDELHALGVKWLKQKSVDPNQPDDAAKGNLFQAFHNMVYGPVNIYKLGIVAREDAPSSRDPDSAASAEPKFKLSRENPGKIREYNKFSNSLLLRDFYTFSRMNLHDPASGNLLGYLYVYYTTPKHDPWIHELTKRYRLYALFVVFIITMLAAYLARGLLLPLRNVMSALESSTPERSIFIRPARSRLEQLYNRMALDAVIARLQGELRDEIARRPQMTGWEAVGFICEVFCEKVQAPLVACLELVAEGPGRIRATGQRKIVGPEAIVRDEAALAELIDSSMPRDGRPSAEFALPEHNLIGVIHLLSDPERTGIRYLFALALELEEIGSNLAPLDNRLTRLAALVETGIQTLALRNQLLVQERGRANISLSRNLGHDLTNIIATSKLDLMALDRLLGRGSLPEDERRRQILNDSLHGLLRSVKFMQETVNLYRSYAFLQHPVLENHDGNQLVAETCELFSMSISAKIDIRTELAEDAPRCVVDPRLIKLALFNLFSNALEAIRKRDPDHTARGWIKVITRRTREQGLCVAIEDSGTGILNSSGARAEKHEIEKIFELGYTSFRRAGNTGEGLGLNWVRTIVQDLHGGKIFAENNPEAGARFVITFPPIELAPDIKNTERKAAEFTRRLQQEARPTDTE